MSVLRFLIILSFCCSSIMYSSVCLCVFLYSTPSSWQNLRSWSLIIRIMVLLILRVCNWCTAIFKGRKDKSELMSTNLWDDITCDMTSLTKLSHNTYSISSIWSHPLQAAYRFRFWLENLKIFGFIWVDQRNRIRWWERARRNKGHSSPPHSTLSCLCACGCVGQAEWLVYGQINCFYGPVSPCEWCWGF